MKLRVYQFAISAGLIVVATGLANATPCPASITSCGCIITSAGVYNVDADLNATTQPLTSRNGCIDVAAKGVTLITNAHMITGAGTGNGIHLLRSAASVFIEGATHNDVSFNCTTLSGWQYALESEASNVISDCFHYNNNTTGILLNGAFNNNINDFTESNNSVYGVWLKGSSRNQINDATTTGSGVAGVYLGCSSTGPTGTVCREDDQTSNGNFIYDHSTGAPNENYGIAVERGSKFNTIMDTVGNTNTLDDLFDGNPNCDSNLWRANSFAKANQSCIQ